VALFKIQKQHSFLFRIYFVHGIILIIAFLILSRLFEYQVKNHAEYAAKAEAQQRNIEEIDAERGEILLLEKDGTAKPAAITKTFSYVYAVPKEITDPSGTSKTLAELMDISEDVLFAKLSKPNDPYELLAKKIDSKIVDAIENLKIKGIYIGKERSRFYPLGEMASHILGFAAKNNKGRLEGKYGIEAYYNAELSGKPGLAQGVRDAAGNVFLRLDQSLPQNGASITLTIDPNIQFKAEEILNNAAEKWQSKSGTVIVLDADTGAIRAFANYPSFDPNNFNKEKNLGVFVNAGVSHRFEPGSVFKAVTIAAGLETGAITPDTTYNDTGEIKIGGYTIRNSDLKAHGTITMTRVLEESYNTGAVFVMQRIGSDKFRQFLENTLRIDTKTGIDLPAETKGDLSGLNPPNGRLINFATAAFGQGIAITPIKLAQIFSVFANGGTLFQPYVVQTIKTSDGKIVEHRPVIAAKNVLSHETITRLNEMLAQVVEQGTGKRAKIKGYTLAGKTGTAQVPNPNGRGYTDETVHSFAAYAPDINPRIVLVMKLDSPKGVRFAEGSVVPAVRELFEFLLQYYEIPPVHPEELKPLSSNP